jgi:hypothetical protein
MKTLRVRGATTHVDMQGERLTKAALEMMAAQDKAHLTPVFNNHDHGLPPLGRQVSCSVEEMEDGEFALVAEWQIWEEGDRSQPDPEGREIAIRTYQPGQRVFSIDASLESAEFLEDLAALEKAGFQIHTERRKAFEARSVAVVGLGLVAAGFLGEIGKDVWIKIREFIKKVRRDKPEAARRIILVLTVRGERDVELDIVLDEPTPEMIDKLLDKGFEVVEKELATLPPNTARVAFRGDVEPPRLEYTVDKNGFPSRIDDVDLSKFGGVSAGFGGRAQYIGTPTSEPRQGITPE